MPVLGEGVKRVQIRQDLTQVFSKSDVFEHLSFCTRILLILHHPDLFVHFFELFVLCLEVVLEIYDVVLEVKHAVVGVTFNLLHLTVSAESVRLREVMAVYLPVESGEVFFRSVPFFVLTRLQSAPVLIRLVMLVEVLYKLLVLHLRLAFVNFVSYSCFTDEPALFQLML